MPVLDAGVSQDWICDLLIVAILLSDGAPHTNIKVVEFFLPR
jgi:hypothetical protein